MLAFLNGMTTMGFLLAAVFFTRFWRRTSDRLFATFAGAFVLLAANQVLLGLEAFPREEQSLAYLLRLAAFTLLIFAVVSKNMERGSANK
jgi:uncharacterized membrane protein YbaN (DUF454 family)